MRKKLKELMDIVIEIIFLIIDIIIEKKPKKLMGIVIGIIVLIIGIYSYKSIVNSPVKTWEEALDKYVEAMIKKDRKKATSYTDTSYYTMLNIVEEEMGASIIEDLETSQETFIQNVEILDEQVKSSGPDSYSYFYEIDIRDLNSYSLYYKINTVNAYNDDFGAKWVDVYFTLKGDFFSNRMTQENVNICCYRISLREYPKKGWKVTWLNAEW